MKIVRKLYYVLSKVLLHHGKAILCLLAGLEETTCSVRKRTILLVGEGIIKFASAKVWINPNFLTPPSPSP